MEEFKEVIFFSLACIGAVIIFTVYSSFRDLTGELVEVRHDEIRAQQTLEIERNYGVYHERDLYGAEVIALLRENALRKAYYTITIDYNTSNNPMVQDIDSYPHYTLEALSELIAMNSVYYAVVDSDSRMITLVRR